MITTTVKNLTGANIHALGLEDFEDDIVRMSATFAVFHGTPGEALMAVQTVMDRIIRESPRGGKDSDYRSLIAVRNKLKKAGVWGEDSPHVEIDDDRVSA